MPNFPTSLDTLTNPSGTDPLSSPDHAGQHATANDILEAVEAKLGTGSSTPTTTGHILTVTGSGASAWQAAAGGASVSLKQMAANFGGVWVTGRYYDGSPTLSNSAGFTLSPNRLYFTPLYVPKAVTADRIALNVTSGVGATLIRLGIFTSHATTGLPDTLLVDGGTIDSSTTGAKEVTISQALSADTLYWTAGVSGGGPAMQARALSGAPSMGVDTSDAVNVTGLNAVFTMGTLPADTSGLTWTYPTGTGTPRFLVRV